MVLFNPKKNRFVHAKEEGDKVIVTITSPGGGKIQKFMSAAEWEVYLQDKKNNGFEEAKEAPEEVKPKEHPLLSLLKQRSRQFVDEYVKLNFKPSKEAIEEAEKLISSLVDARTLMEFNDILERIFALVPRKMKNPILYLAKNLDGDEMRDIIEREESIIKGLSSLSSTYDPFVIKDCSEDEKRKVLSLVDKNTRPLCSNIYRIEDKRLARFKKYLRENEIKKTSFLFHGSRTENWYSILTTGLKINPVNVIITGKMFGHGIYFAPKAKKSVGYTSLLSSRWANGNEKTAYLAVYEVATGNEEIVERYTGDLGSLTKEKFKKYFPKKDSLHAVAGVSLVNDEVIVYDENACIIRYLIELKC